MADVESPKTKPEAKPEKTADAKPEPTKLLEGGQLVDHRDGREVVLRLRDVRTQFGDHIVHDHLDFDVFKGEIVGLVGGSGSGKSVLLRAILGLNDHTQGTIEVLGDDLDKLHGQSLRDMQARTGVQFQDGALFSSLTVSENIIVPIREHIGLDEQTMREIAALKVAMVGLPPDTGAKKPSELSGGMRKRASLARALALDAELLFLDEPTAGLDPIGAAHYDELVKGLNRSLGLTILMVTHDLDSLYAVCDRIAVLLDKRVVVGTMDELLNYDHPWVREYFHGPRGRAAAPKERSGV
jgi:phospholipid/cholesterol/gamma-HCH transport system ATP-binding protein